MITTELMKEASLSSVRPQTAVPGPGLSSSKLPPLVEVTPGWTGTEPSTVY